jgi:hypothetical protein
LDEAACQLRKLEQGGHEHVAGTRLRLAAAITQQKQLNDWAAFRTAKQQMFTIKSTRM